MDNNIDFFLHGEALRDVIRQSHRVMVATMHKHVTFINFQAGVHNTIMELKLDSAKQAHQAGFMIVDMGVDTIIQEWPE